ncbi:MAG TPA: TIGR00730 family Rossman fold protein, partial [Phenylobacterium sp.]|nr:TIGR00730 family Rossman fold protein [Phenylobacterium sp.]
MGHDPAPLTSVCVFCGSSDAADPALFSASAELGRAIAAAKLRLIYGGGGVGLMGACAIAAHEAGGQVLGIIPEFLKIKERRLDVVETITVTSMHERKLMMFEQADSFVVLPGGVGTLEEIVELLSWRRLDLHAKPVVFWSPNGFWDPLFALFQHTVEHRFTPPEFMDSWVTVEAIEDV